MSADATRGCLKHGARDGNSYQVQRNPFNTGKSTDVQIPIEDGIAVIQGLEAFVWVNERSRARPWGNGLTMRGMVTSLPTRGRITTVTIHINQRLPVGFGMNALRNLPSDAARDLYQCIQPRRHCKIWGLSAGERDVLDEVFRF